MATEARKLQVGIFVIAATVLAIALLIWLGATRLFEQNVKLATYFSESVQGLEPGAAVKYRGVPAGRVENIRIAPDNNLIEVVMSMDDDTASIVEKDPTLRAQLQLVGITGLRYVEIDRQTGKALHQSPHLDFKPPYPVIPSTRSSFKLIQTALQDIYDKVMTVDLKGISDDARSTLQSVNDLLRDKRIDTVLTNFADASQSASDAAKNLDRVSHQVDVEPVMQNLTAASENAKALFAELNKGNVADQLAQTVTYVNRLAQTMQQFVVGLQYTIDRLNRSAANLDHLTEEVARQPSRLLFSEPPKSRRPNDRSEQ